MNFSQVAIAISQVREGWNHLENETAAIDAVARAIASELRHYDMAGEFSVTEFLAKAGVSPL